MNRKDRGAVVGMVLGDGYIRTESAADKRAGRRVAPQLVMAHSIDQKRYLQWKVGLLNRIFGGKATVRHHAYQGHARKVQASKSSRYFRTLKGIMYRDGEKEITPQVLNMLTVQGIAIWFMDDGSYRLNRRNDGSVSSVALTLDVQRPKEEAELVAEYFRERHGVLWKLARHKRTGLYSLRTNTQGARDMAALIGDDLVPTMRYKIACVHQLDGHERPAPDKICAECGKTFGALKAKGLCMKCYNDRHFRSQNQKTRTCSICGQDKTGWFCGDRCSACYQKQRRVMR